MRLLQYRYNRIKFIITQCVKGIITEDQFKGQMQKLQDEIYFWESLT